MKRPSLFLFIPALTFAAIDGTVVNGTAGKPQPGALVTLYRLGDSGMQPVKTLKSDAAGKFRFEQDVQGPHLLQIIHSGVIYNQMLTPGSPTSGLSVEVFDSSRKPGEARIAQHMVLLEPVGNELRVSENVVFQNTGRTSYNDPANGTLRVFLPEAARGQARVRVTAPGGLPVERSAEKTPRAGAYKIDFPIKPGETRFDITYSMPFTSPGSYSGKVLHKDGPVRLVVPAGVSLSGGGLKPLGQEPQTQASIYEIESGDYKVELQGTGSLRAGAAADEESGPSIEQILPRVYNNVAWIVGLSLAILLLGFMLLYRRAPSVPPAGIPRPAAPRGKRRA
jgi:hypothetical protein